VDRIKRISYEVLDKHKSKFGEDFADNKKSLDEVSIIRSKGLKNKVAGYITRFIKKEIREEKSKQAKITSSQFGESVDKEVQAETTEPTTTEPTTTEPTTTEPTTTEPTTTEPTTTEPTTTEPTTTVKLL